MDVGASRADPGECPVPGGLRPVRHHLRGTAGRGRHRRHGGRLPGHDDLAHQLHVLRNPERLVLDLDGIDASSELALLPSRVHASDPYVAAIRVGRQSPTALRVVIDLKRMNKILEVDERNALLSDPLATLRP